MPPDAGTPALLAAALKRDRLVLAGALILLTLMAGLYTLFGVGMKMSALEMTAMAGGGMGGMGAMAMHVPAWSPAYAALIFLMWWVMMIAMMLPSAAPMILLYAGVKRRTGDEAQVLGLTAIFAAGYLAIWAVFSILAAALQWALELRGLVSPGMMTLTSQTLGALLLIAAGAYQLTPLKQACLEHCRSPAHFLSRHHRPGRGGAFRLGLAHGAYCLGCCWFLMALLFFGGIMNLYWIVGLAVFVMAEKLLPGGERVGRLAGVALLATGLWMLAAAVGAV